MASPPTRIVFCPACGRKLKIPMASVVGKQARCGVCDTKFGVPAPIDAALVRPSSGSSGVFQRPSLPEPSLAPVAQARAASAASDAERRTGVQQIRLDQLPADLLEVIGPLPTEEEQAIALTTPSRRALSATAVEGLERQAFDLDAENHPVRRTGVGMIRLSDLRLPPEEPPPKQRK